MFAKQLAAIVCALAVTLAPYSAAFAETDGGGGRRQQKFDMDLSSTERNLTAGRLVRDSAVNITVDGQSREVTGATPLTAAERLAVFQVMKSGQQSILLGADGNAVGGSMAISRGFSRQVESLSVPVTVNVIADFARGNLNFIGDLVNAGNFFAVSSTSRVRSANINADNIVNSGLLTNILPTGGIAGFSGTNHLDSLSLNAVRDIINSGTISSSGGLSLSAGGNIANQAGATMTAQNLNLYSALGNFTNAGSMLATSGSINIAAATANSIVFNNAGGLMQALRGAINFGDSIYTPGSLAGISLRGGDLAAETISLMRKGGDIFVDVNTLEGEVSVTAANSQMHVQTGGLNVVSMDLSEDPVFTLGSGTLELTFSSATLNTAGEQFVALSGGDVQLKSDSPAQTVTIQTGGGLIRIGAGVTFETTNNTITGESSTGGDIKLSTVSLDSDGGNITLTAKDGTSNGSKGGIQIGGVSSEGLGTVVAGQNGGAGGTITITADKTVATGAITSSGGRGGDAGAATSAGTQSAAGGGLQNSITNVTSVTTTTGTAPNQVTTTTYTYHFSDGSTATSTMAPTGNAQTGFGLPANFTATGGTAGSGGSNGGAYSDGGNGAAGGDGGVGTAGGHGGSAGAITITAPGAITLGQLTAQGGVGGSGGNGGSGGTGGNGGAGGDSYAVTNAGDGGNGGNGGKGGNGGLGGNGGSGAAISITSSAGSVSTTGIQTSGANGGVGGKGGDGGGGGKGGAGGIAYGIGASGDGGSGGVGGGAGSGAAAGNGGTAGAITITAATTITMNSSSTGIFANGANGGKGGDGGVGGSGGGGASGEAGLVGGAGGSAGGGGSGGAGSGGGAGGNGAATTLTANSVTLKSVRLNGGAGGAGGAGGNGNAAGLAGSGQGGLGGGTGGAGGGGGAASSGAGGARGGNGGNLNVFATTTITLTDVFEANGGNAGNGGKGGSGGSGSSGADGGGGIISGSGGAGGGGSSATAGGGGGVGGNGGLLYLSAATSNIATKSISTIGGVGGNGGDGGNGGAGGNGGTSGVGLIGENGATADPDTSVVSGTIGVNVGTTGADGGVGGRGAGGGLGGKGGNGGDVIVLAPMGSITVDGSLNTYGNNSGVDGTKGIDGVNGQNGSFNTYFGLAFQYGARPGTFAALGPQLGLGGSLTIANVTVGGLAWLGAGIQGYTVQGVTIFANMKNPDGTPSFDYVLNAAATGVSSTLHYDGLTIGTKISLVGAAGQIFSGVAPSELKDFVDGVAPNFSSGQFATHTTTVTNPIPPPNTLFTGSAVGGTQTIIASPGTQTLASTGGNVELTAGTSLTVNGNVNALGGRTVQYSYTPNGCCNNYNIIQTFYMGAGGSVVARAPQITVAGLSSTTPAVGGGSIAFVTRVDGADVLIKPMAFAQLKWGNATTPTILNLNVAGGGDNGTILATSPITLIQNKTGSLDLGSGTGGQNLFASGSYSVNGDLVILASGNITATGTVNTISAGSSTARPNGQIIMAAGDAAAGATYGNAPGQTAWLVLGAASTTGGAIQLTNTIGSERTALIYAEALGVTGQAQGFIETGALTTSTAVATAQRPGTVILSASSNIRTGTITTTSAKFQSFDGDIGVANAAVSVNAKYLSVLASRNAYLTDSASEVNLLSSQVGLLSVAATGGNLIVAGPVTGGAILLQSSQSVFVRSTVTTTTGVDGVIAVVSNNSITDANGLSNLTAPNILLTSGNVINLTNGLTTVASSATTKSSITLNAGVSVTAAGLLSTNVLGLTAGNGGITVSNTNAGDVVANTLGNVNITASGAVRLGGSTALYSLGQDFTLTAGGAITVQGPVEALGVLTLTSGNNGSITQIGNIIAGTSATLTAHGSGSILSPQSGAISSPVLHLISGTGDIGGSAITPIFSNASILSFATTGKVNIVVSNDHPNLNLDSWSGTSLNLVKFGNLFLGGALTATGQIGIATFGGTLEVDAPLSAGGNLSLMAVDLVDVAASSNNKVLLKDNVTSTAGTVSLGSGSIGSVTLNQGKSVTGLNVLAVTPTLSNNGSVIANGTGSNGNVSIISDASNKALAVVFGSGSSITASRNIDFNSITNLGAITMNNQNGTIAAGSGTGNITFHGGSNAVAVDVGIINGIVGGTGAPLSIVTRASNIDTLTLDSTGTITVHAMNGNVTVRDNVTGSGTVSLTSKSTGSVTVNADKSVTGSNVTVVTPTLNLNGSIVANGTGANGNVTISSNKGDKALTVTLGSGASISGAGLVSFNTTGNRGAITMNSQNGSIAAGAGTGMIHFFGGTGAVSVDVSSINGIITGGGTHIFVTARTGNLKTSDLTATVNLELKALAGNLTVAGEVGASGDATLESVNSGSVTVDQNKSVTGTNVFVITPTLNNNGSISANGTGSNGNLSVTSNAGSTALTVTLGSGSTMTANGSISFNSDTSRGAITMNSQNGSISAGAGNGTVNIYGGTSAVDIDAASISGILSGDGAPLSVVTHSGNLVATALNSADNITVKALGGDVTVRDSLGAEGTIHMESVSTGSVTVNQNASVRGADVTIVTPTLNHDGSIEADGTGNAGNVSVSSNAGNNALMVNLGSGSSIMASRSVSFNTDTNRGAITMNSQNGSIEAAAGAGFVYFYGGTNAVAVDVNSINGIISGNGAPFSLMSHSGNLVSSVLDSSDTITLNALNGDVTIVDAVTAEGSVTLKSSTTGSVTVNQTSVTGSDVNIDTPTLNNDGAILANGTDTAGNVKISSNASSKALAVTLGDDATITGNGFVAFNASDNLGAITMTSQKGDISAGAGAGSVFLHGGSNAVAVDAHSIVGIVTGTGAPLSVVTQSGDLEVSGLESTSDITVNPLSGDLVVSGNVKAPGTVSLTSPQQIIQTGGTVEALHLQMAAGLGGILSSAVDQHFVTVVNNGDLTVTTSGSSLISNTGVLTLLDSIAGGSFDLKNSDSLTMHDLATTGGRIFVQAAKGTLSVVDNAIVQAAGGTLTLNNSDDSAGTIAIGKEVAILDSFTGGAVIKIVLGDMRTPDNDKEPDNVTARTPAGGTVFFGPNSITASEPGNVVQAAGSNAQVIFDTGNRPADAITLGGSDFIAASNGTALNSLDLTDPAVVAAILSQQKAGLLGGKLVLDSNNVVVDGGVTLTPVDITRTISAFNAPANVQVRFDNFLSSLPVTVKINAASTTNQVIVDGRVKFGGRLEPHGVLNINSNQLPGQPALIIGLRGELRTSSGLTVNSNGAVSILGSVGGPITVRTSNTSNGDIMIGEQARIISRAPTRTGAIELIAAGDITNAGYIFSGDDILFSARGMFSTAEDSTVSLSRGTLWITAAGLSIAGDLHTDARTVVLNTNSPSQVISVGEDTHGAFNVSSETFQHIRAKSIVIGNNAHTGGIVVAGSFESPSRSLTLQTSGNIYGDGTVSAVELILLAGGNIGSDSEHLMVKVGTLTAAAGGNTYVQGTQGMSLTGESSAAGAGGFNLWANGNIKLMSGATVDGDTSVSLVATMKNAKISQANEGTTIYSPVINLETGAHKNSQIGAKSQYIEVESGSVGVSPDVSAAAGGKVYVTGGEITIQNLRTGGNLRTTGIQTNSLPSTSLWGGGSQTNSNQSSNVPTTNALQYQLNTGVVTGSSGSTTGVGIDFQQSTGSVPQVSTNNNTLAAVGSSVNTALSSRVADYLTSFEIATVGGFNPENIVVFDGASVRSESEIAPGQATSSEHQSAELVPVALVSGSAPNDAKLAVSAPACTLPGAYLLDSSSVKDAVRQLNARGIDAGVNAGEGSIILRRGSVLFAADRKMVVQTASGRVLMEAGSVVLVTVTDNCVAVYDLHDRQMSGVVVTTGTKSVALAPGRHVLLTHQGIHGLEQVNPLGCIGHRNVKMKDLEQGVRQFSSDFSIISALNGLKPLIQMTRSNSPRDARAIERILKTAAVVAQMGGMQDPYRQMSH